MKKYIVISLILFAAFSCTKTIDFDDEGLANQLVLNSIVYPDQGITAYLTFSTSILSRPTLAGGGLMADGTIEIYENGELIKQKYSPTGRFEFPEIRPKTGATYQIVGKSHDKQLKAETTVPNKVEVISIDTATVSDQFINKRLRVNVKIKDASGDDFYRIKVSQENLVLNMNVDGKGTQKYYLYTSEDWISSDDPVFNSLYNNFGGEEFDIGPANDYNIFPDDYFKGKEYNIQFFINNYEYGSGSYYSGYESYGASKTIYKRRIVHVQRLSKDLYTYLKYLKLYDFYHDNPFAEPVPVYSNVKNGVGIFAGFNDDAKFTYEKIYVPFSMDTITVEENSYIYGW
ncbi:MAG: hypothetical protein A2066_03170 [Bacteroidetes bacterium GWB2_41_8]|nr:MAG: hypothetical protein A2066_03170 [Bacteroidetes bacterium GWB2_41_8]